MTTTSANPARSAVRPIPPGYRTVTPHMCIKGCADAIEFYKKAFGAVERSRAPMPDGRLMHAEVLIGDSIVMLHDDMPEMCGGQAKNPIALGGSPMSIHLYVEDADKAFDRAVKAGCTVVMPLMDAFWGDRFGVLKDPFGHEWSVATHNRDLTPQQMEQEFKAAMGGGKK